jgi:hypothetical protein
MAGKINKKHLQLRMRRSKKKLDFSSARKKHAAMKGKINGSVRYLARKYLAEEAGSESAQGIFLPYWASLSA